MKSHLEGVPPGVHLRGREDGRHFSCVRYGTEEHAHLVVTFPTTVTVAELVKQVKGVSSHLVNAGMARSVQFKWQGYYGAFTISRWDVDQIVRYVQRQQEHHARGEVRPEWEETFVEIQDADA